MEKASWPAGKTATMYELVPKSQDMKEKCVVGTNQDATSTRRWDLSQGPRTQGYPRLQNQIKIENRVGKVTSGPWRPWFILEHQWRIYMLVCQTNQYTYYIAYCYLFISLSHRLYISRELCFVHFQSLSGLVGTTESGWCRIFCSSLSSLGAGMLQTSSLQRFVHLQRHFGSSLTTDWIWRFLSKTSRVGGHQAYTAYTNDGVIVRHVIKTHQTSSNIFDSQLILQPLMRMCWLCHLLQMGSATSLSRCKKIIVAT